MFVPLRSALYASSFVLLWGWLAASVRPFDARLTLTLPAWAQPLGWGLALLGALLTFWCVATFTVKGRGTPAPFDPPREFVAAGPYRYVRNPMYIGGFGVLLGAGLILRSPSIAGLALLFLLLTHLLVWFYEEPSLTRRFGDPYVRYKSTVHRWLPRAPHSNAVGAAGVLLLLGVLPLSTASASPQAAANAVAEGQELLAKRGLEDIRAAVGKFERATSADGSYAPAFAGLAEARALLFEYPAAREAALRAIELDDRQATAHAVLGFVKLHGDWDWAGAEAEFKRALELDPRNPTAHLWSAIVLEATGRTDEAVAAARRAVEFAPGQAQMRAGLGYRLYWARRYDEAVAELEASLKQDPKSSTAHYFIGRARVQQGRFDEARAAFARAREISPEDANLKSATAYLEARAGRREASEKLLLELQRLSLRGLPFSSQVAGVRAALGDKEAALGWLEQAQSAHEAALVWVKIDPRFDSLREEPRFKEILERMGL